MNILQKELQTTQLRYIGICSIWHHYFSAVLKRWKA